MVSCNLKKSEYAEFKSYAYFFHFKLEIHFLVPKFNGVVDFFRFPAEILFLSKFGPKYYNCQFKLKFGTYAKSKMNNSKVVFTFYVLHQDTLFEQIRSKKSKLSV